MHRSISKHRPKTIVFRTIAVVICSVIFSVAADAEETYVSIQKVSGNRMLVVKDLGGGAGRGGRGMRGGGNAAGAAQGRGRGRRGGATTGSDSVTVTVPASAKITSAMRERRTFEFRVLGELPGGLRHRVFQNMQKPLQARIVTKGNVITEVNVISGETDINQTGTDASGQTVIAVRPKRPPMKRKP